jgi:hypothetical protein
MSKNCVIRPHSAGLWSLINNVATCYAIYDNVFVDWRGGHLYGNAQDGDLWLHLFNNNPPYPHAEHDKVNDYPKGHETLTYLHAAQLYPHQGWRKHYNAIWQRFGVREEWADRVAQYLVETFGTQPYIAALIRADTHRGEQVGGRSQTLKEYEDAIRAEITHMQAATGQTPGVYIAAGDDETLEWMRRRFNCKYYPHTRRSRTRASDFHLTAPQHFHDAVNCLVEVMIMAQAHALVHPVSNMATGALYINPGVQSIYIQ